MPKVLQNAIVKGVEMRKVLSLTLAVMGIAVMAHAFIQPPSKWKRVDDVIENKAGDPVRVVVGNDTMSADTGTFYYTVDFYHVSAGDSIKFEGTVVINGYSLPSSTGATGEVLKQQADGSVDWGSDQTGSGLMDTVSHDVLVYVDPVDGDTVLYVADSSGYVRHYNISGSGFSFDEQVRIEASGTGLVVAGIAATEVTNVNGIIPLNIYDQNNRLKLNSGGDDGIEFYEGAVMLLLMDDSLLSGRDITSLSSFEYIQVNDSLWISGAAGSGYIDGSYIILDSLKLGTEDVLTSWDDVPFSDADSVNGTPVNLTGLSAGDLLYYDGTDIVPVTVSWADSVADSAASSADENVEDKVGNLFTSGSHTDITVTYNDGSGTIDLEVTGGSGAGLITWAGEDNLAILTDSTGDTIFQIERADANTTVLKAEDGEEISIGDTTKYARAPYGIIAGQIYIEDTTVADSMVATHGYAKEWGGQEVLLPFRTVAANPEPDDDSVFLIDNVYRGGNVVLFRDSTAEGSDESTVRILADIPYDFDCDSFVFDYLTNGNIDSIKLYNPDDGTYLADSLHTLDITGWSSGTAATISIAWDRNFDEGEMAMVEIFDALADDNDRTVGIRAHLVGVKR